MAISKKAWTGIAKEVTPGTLVQPPTKFIPTKTVFKGGKKREYLNEERGDRNANYGVVDSVRQSSIEMKGPYYPDTSPIIMWGGMGLPSSAQPDSAGAPNVWKHTFQLQDIPPSYTITRSMDSRTYSVAYSAVEKWSLHFTADGKLLELDGTWLGLFAQLYNSPPTPTYSTALPMAGYAPTIKFVDGATSMDVSDMQIDFEQKLLLWYPASGSPDFVTVYYGERSFKVDVTARFDNDTLYQRWRNNVMDSLNFDVLGAQIGKTITVTLGAPSAGTFTLSYNGQTTAGLAYNATAAAVQTALQGLTSVGATNATVSGSAGGPYTVSFQNGLLADGFTLTGSGTGLTGGALVVGAQTNYFNEINIVLPQLSWDTMEHDVSKENVLIKGKGTAIVPAGSSLVTGYVQNLVPGSGYTS